ncbi:ABC transporter ATP-binding protein [Paraneptunicella aestuarii]|uniref:ATP-binding cassette domain-containing protein n=1 Tax=Paraneptunicella aestuarii TaxID=2831148 RepID=UPI001E407B1D|nr:ABC transporter ATP-binding protein [Paraneptunicella aestuarii]UAA39731.1 ABC transporter ATP-binding protein [Paraneptunicella aestuarii]
MKKASLTLARLIFLQHKWHTGLLLSFIFLVSLFSFMLPLMFSVVIEQVLPQQLQTHFYLLLLMSIALVILRFFLNGAQDYLFLSLRTTIERQVSLDFLTKAIWHYPATELQRVGHIKLANRLMLWLSNFQYFLSEFIFFCGYAVVVSVLVFVVLFMVQPGFALWALAFLVLHWLNFHFHHPIVKALSGQYNQAKGELAQLLGNSFAAKRMINVSQSEGLLLQSLDQELMGLHSQLNGREQAANAQELIQNLLRAIQFMGFVLLGMYGIEQQQLSIGELLLCILLIGLAYQPVYRLSAVTKSLAEAQSQLQQIAQVIDCKNNNSSESAEALKHEIELVSVANVTLENVTLRRSDKTLLNAQSATFQRGNIYLIEGVSGAGKSTLLQLLAGVVAPDGGAVLWDKANPQQLSIASQSEQVTWMGQYSGFVEGTIIENLTGFASEVDWSRVEEVLQLAGCEFLLNENSSLDRSKLETALSPNAEQFSGGQAQRLNLARALYQHAQIRCFDEPTANLDVATEAAIFDALQKTKQDCITFIVSHKPSTRRIADEVLLLNSGQLQKEKTQGGVEQ